MQGQAGAVVNGSLLGWEGRHRAQKQTAGPAVGSVAGS